MDNKKIVKIVAIVGAIGFIVFAVSSYLLSGSDVKPEPTQSYVDSDGNPHLKPVKDPSADTADDDQQSYAEVDYDSKQRAFNDYWQSNTDAFDDWQVAIYDEQDKLTYQASSRPQSETKPHTMTLASVTKVGILASYLRTSNDLDTAHQQLAEKMITKSDNDSAQKLYSEVEKRNPGSLQRTYQAMGTENTTVDPSHWGLTKSTALDQIKVLTSVFNDSANNGMSAEQQQYMRGLMQHVTPTQQWGVGQVAKNAYLKNGWLPDDETATNSSDDTTWTVNSIGHVTKNNRQFDIAVLTHGAEFDNATQQLSTMLKKSLRIVQGDVTE